MSSALDDAVHEFNVLRENPSQKIKIPKDDSKKESINYFSRDELNMFLEAVKKPQKNAKYQHSIQNYVLFFLLSRTGLRIGEALALTWDDIDIDQQTLTVDKNTCLSAQFVSLRIIT